MGMSRHANAVDPRLYADYRLFHSCLGVRLNVLSGNILLSKILCPFPQREKLPAVISGSSETGTSVESFLIS